MNFNGIVGLYSKCIPHNLSPKVLCSRCWNLLLTLVQHVVWFVIPDWCVILVPSHSLLVGMVSYLSSISFIQSSRYVGDLGSFSSHYLLALTDPFPYYKQVHVTHYALFFVSKSFLGHLCCKIDFNFFRLETKQVVTLLMKLCSKILVHQVRQPWIFSRWLLQAIQKLQYKHFDHHPIYLTIMQMIKRCLISYLFLVFCIYNSQLSSIYRRIQIQVQ